MRFPRASGILLHPTSLPGRYGVGDLGPQAYRFLDFLQLTGQSIWQVLPLGPTGYGDSPYQCFSAFAGNHLLISPDVLVEQGHLSPADVEHVPAFLSVALLLPQSGHAHDRPQLQRPGALPARDLDCLMKTGFRLGLRCPLALRQQQLPLDPV